VPGDRIAPACDSLFERCSWLYAFCREYLFRDHTPEITSALFPSETSAAGTKLLELGCGPGLYACRFAKNFPKITATGIDLSRPLLRRARTRASNLHLQNCRFYEGDAQALKELPQSVDAVIVSRLFLIIPDKTAVLAEIFRILRPGGRCFIAEPTSGFRTRIPLGAMWLFARLTASPFTRYREPQQAEIMPRADFQALVNGPSWASVDMHYDDWYQYAVCQKSKTQSADQAGSNV